MIPAQAVPWPTRSPPSGSSTTGRSSAVELDAELADEPPADRRMLAVHAGVDDRDRDPAPVGVAEDRGPVQAAERQRRCEPSARGRRRTARSRPGAGAVMRRSPDGRPAALALTEQRVEPVGGELDRVGVDVASRAIRSASAQVGSSSSARSVVAGDEVVDRVRRRAPSTPVRSPE